ncbi:MAG TPA: PAS domain S-box protein [Pyrinomonadaceae bacterium]|nr:PAS domain S-box protein [Pyrinomonadaceae bacterium]
MTQELEQAETPRGPARRSEELFRAAFEQSPMSTQILSPDGRTVWVNRAWERLWGVTLEQLGDYNVLEDPQLEEKGIAPHLRRAFAGEAAELPAILYDPEETIPNTSSHREPARWVRAFAFPVMDESGGLREVVLMHEDITARRRAEEEARRWAEVFEHVQWGVVLGDAETGKLLAMNPAYARMHGYEVEELAGRPIADVFAPEVHGTLAEHIRTTVERGYNTMKSLHVRKDGSVFPVAVETTAIRDERGRLLYMAAHVQDITERERVEAELRRSEENYRGLLDNANDIIYSHDLAGKYLAINRAGAEITGYTREEILGGLNIAQVVAPEHLEVAKAMTALKLKDPSPTVYAVDIVTRDGRRLTLEVSTRISYRDGVPVAVEGIARDVTERKRAEAEIQRSKQQIEIILQGVAESIIAQDTEGRIVYANDMAARSLGYSSADELLELPSKEIVKRYEIFDEGGGPFPAERMPARVALREGLSASAVMRYRSVGAGEERWASVKATPVFDEEGRVRFAISIFQDITERRRAEESQKFLAEAGSRIASSLDYETTLASVARMAVPVLADWCTVDVLEEDGRLKRLAVTHVDPKKIEWAYELQERYPPDMNAAQGVPQVLRTGRSELYPLITDEMLVAGAIDEEHLQIMRGIGFTSAIIAPLVAQGRTVGVITFISAESGRRYGQEELALAENLAHRAGIAVDNARLYRSAQEANRLKDEFLATVSHELRTPLTAILGWASMLRKTEFDRQTAQNALETIERNARAQSQIIDDLLDVSRIVTGKLRLDVRQVEPVSFIDAAVESVRPAAEAKGVRLSKVLDTGPTALTGDPSRLQQVVWNLLTNAVKFTPRGGRVEIRLSRVGSSLEIAVSDTGAGVKREFLPYVFDRFRQADSSTTRRHGGLGLGLSIVRHLVELHGGTVRADSAGEGEGSTFTVRLPVAPVVGRDAATEARGAGGASAERVAPADDCPAEIVGLKILVVDDEEDTRDLLRTALGGYGAQVLVAATAQEALDIAASEKPDVLVSDIGMPDVDGFELIRRVRELPAESGGGVPAIALTAYARAEDRLRVLRSGYQMHVPKPVEMAELLTVIASLVKRK